MKQSRVDKLIAEYQRLKKLAQEQNGAKVEVPQPPEIKNQVPQPEKGPPAQAGNTVQQFQAATLSANLSAPMPLVGTAPTFNLSAVPSWQRGRTARQIAATTGEDWRQILADYYASTGDVSKYNATMKNITAQNKQNTAK